MWMDQILPPELNDLELEALREIAVHPASHHIPFRVESRLKDIGYARDVLGDLVLTDDGLRRAAVEDDRQQALRDAIDVLRGSANIAVIDDR